MTHSRNLPQNSPFLHPPFGGISAFALRVFAILFMVLDHLWAKLIPGSFWMTCVGRLAFPIFAFQVVEGFFHTHDLSRYIKRLLVFALLSEIPFDLFYSGSVFFPFHQNVLFTLLLGLLAISAMERAKTMKSRLRAAAFGIAVPLLAVLLGQILFVDYAGLGVMTVIAFYLLRGFPFAWVGQFLFLLFFHGVLFSGQILTFSLFGTQIHVTQQGLAVFSLLFIWLYNGKPGHHSRAVRWGGYLFYPIHMLIIYALVRIFL